jgi:L-serine/L-threonine ammonia-lyase
MALKACQDVLEDRRVLVEPFCGAALSIAHPMLERFENIVIVVCGGATMTVA